MCRKKIIAYIAVGSIFAVTLGNTSISSAADSTLALQPLNMKDHMLAYADMAIIFLRHIMFSYRFAGMLRRYLPELWYFFI